MIDNKDKFSRDAVLDAHKKIVGLIGNDGARIPKRPVSSYLVRVNEAASITGLPASLIRKSFMNEAKREANVPPPPPHKRIGRAVYIVRDKLAAWVESIDNPAVSGSIQRRPGRPTVAERIERRRQREASLLRGGSQT